MIVRRVLSAILVVAPACGLLGAPPAPAGAAAADPALEVAVTAGFGGYGLPGSTIPVRVRISAAEPVRATVEASFVTSEGSVAARVADDDVEIPAAGVAEHILLVPMPLSGPGIVEARVLGPGGTVAARGRSDVVLPDGVELVGVLPATLAGRQPPGPAPLAVDAGVAQFHVLDEAIPALAPASLESLGTIALPAAGLDALPPGSAEGLLQWLAAGGRLLVDAEPGSAVPGLPDAWQPGPGGRAWAGLGEVVATAGAMAAGRWERLVEPTLRGGAAPAFENLHEYASVPVAQDAGVEARGPGWLFAYLVLYVAVAGPGTFLVLRRLRRDELAWVVVPVVALVFTAGGYAQGRSARAAAPAQGSIVLSTPAGPARAHTWVGVVAGETGPVRVGFPAGWAIRSTAAPGGVAGGAVRAVHGAGGPEAVLELSSGQWGLVLASGSVDDGDGLAVSAAVEGGRLTGTVRNATPFGLEEVAVVVGPRSAPVGALAPGAEARWELSGDVPAPGGTFTAPFAEMAPDGPVAYGLWQALQAALGPDRPAPGIALAVGWTRDLRPAVRVGGSDAGAAGRTMVVAPTRFAGAEAAVPGLAVARTHVRGAGLGAPGTEGRALGPSVLRFDLPAGTVPGRLAVTAPTAARVERWSEGTWRELDGGTAQPSEPSAGGPVAPGPVPRRPEALPPEGASLLTEYDLGAAEPTVWLRVTPTEGAVGGGSLTWVRGMPA